MNAQGEIRDDLQLPTETDNDKVVATRITEALEEMKDCFCTVLKSMGIEKVIESQIKTGEN